MVNHLITRHDLLYSQTIQGREPAMHITAGSAQHAHVSIRHYHNMITTLVTDPRKNRPPSAANSHLYLASAILPPDMARSLSSTLVHEGLVVYALESNGSSDTRRL